MSEIRSRVEQIVPLVLTFAAMATVLLTLVFSAVSTFSLEYFEDNLAFIYLLNAISIVVLGTFIAIYIRRFWVRLKARVAGTHLAIRFLRTFAVVALLSLGVIYCFTYFSIRGLISGWVEKQVKDTVSEASQLQKSFLDVFKERIVLDLTEYVEQLKTTDNVDDIPRIIFDARISGDFEEITYFSDPGSPTGILASSAESLRVESLVPINPSNKLIGGMLSGEDKLNKKPTIEIFNLADEGLMLRLLIPVRRVDSSSYHYLQVIQKLSKSSENLAEQISAVEARYNRLIFLRKPIQINFLMTLTLIMLVVLLFSIWIVMKVSNRLVQPIQALSEGTREVAAGNYERLLPVTTKDDLGGLVESFNNMTKKIKTSQEKIEEQRSFLEVVLQNLSSGVIFIDNTTSASSINLAAASILDVSVERFKNRSLEGAIKSYPQLEPLLSPIQNGILADQNEWNGSVAINSEQGAKILTYSATRIQGEKKELVSYVVVIEDITDLVQAQRFEAWTEVAKKYSHELLNPLQPIRLAVDRIKVKTDTNLSDDVSRTLERAFKAIDRQLDALIRIAKSMKEYANLPEDFYVEPFDINELISDSIIFHFDSDDRVQVEKDFAPDLPPIKADPSLMLQVMNNVLINARDAGRDCEKLIIRIETKFIEPDTIKLKFVDNGPGFNQTMLDNAFGLFESTKPDKGSGLGLSIVKKIIDEHGGEIEVANNPDGGAEITIMLKLGHSYVSG